MEFEPLADKLSKDYKVIIVEAFGYELKMVTKNLQEVRTMKFPEGIPVNEN
ncbi:MAG TPA: hypothetical protein IAC41_00835 [Candidatus Merdenecus merdavium]|nr:hypothetical protein [Candidatus Merdenecus merdavium]